MVVNSTTVFYISLHNFAREISSDLGSEPSSVPSAVLNPGHLSFHPSSLSHKPAPPISLLARLDSDEYILLPNSSSLVAVRAEDLEPTKAHEVRIIAPMSDESGCGIFEFEGIWLDNGGKLLRVEGSQLEEAVEYEDDFDAENARIGSEHQDGLEKLANDPAGLSTTNAKPSSDEDSGDRFRSERRRVLEVVTDAPGALVHRNGQQRTGGGDGILGGVMGWEYLLGEMYSVDHVSIGVDGMCLIQECIGGTGQPAGMGDVFFRRWVDLQF